MTLENNLCEYVDNQNRQSVRHLFEILAKVFKKFIKGTQPESLNLALENQKQQF